MKMMDIGIVNTDRLRSELKEFYNYIIDKQISKEVYEYTLKKKVEGLLGVKCDYEEIIKDYIGFFKDVKYVKTTERVFCEDEHYIYEVYIHIKKIEDEKHIVIIDIDEIYADIGEKEEDEEDDSDYQEEDFEDDEHYSYCFDCDIEESSDYDYQEDDFY